MKINSKDFRVESGEKVDLSKKPTMVKPFCKSKKHYQKHLRKHVEELTSLQRLHYASNRYALMLIFQGMDAAGKDGAIRHVMSGINPQGCEVFSFKQPSAEELEHDFLWRTTCHLPERGRIGIFNALTTKKCWSFAYTRRFCAVRDYQKSCATRKTFGQVDMRPVPNILFSQMRRGKNPTSRQARCGAKQIFRPGRGAWNSGLRVDPAARMR